MPESAMSDEIITIGMLQYSSFILGVEIDNLLEVAPIENLQPCLDQSARSLGLVSIRGTLVPVLDPADFFSAPPRADKPSVAAVITDGSSVFCLGVDAVLGIRSVSAATVQKVNGHPVIQIGDDRNVYVVDTGGPKVSCKVSGLGLRQERSESAAVEIARPFLAFSAGGVNYGIEATHIFGTIPSRKLDYSHGAGSVFFGFIHESYQKIPLINSPEIFGVGESLMSCETETIVLDPGDGRRVGLAVDKIIRIIYLRPSQLTKIEQGCFFEFNFFNAIYVESNENYLLIDAPSLFGDENFLEILDLFERGHDDDIQENGEAGLTASGGLIRERERQLVVFAGERFSIPLAWVERVIVRPPRMIANRLQKNGFLGHFIFQGGVIPLLCLARILFEGSPKVSDRSRVLLVARGNEMVGLLVESVEDIGVSRWRCFENSRDNFFSKIEVVQGGCSEILNGLNLESLLEDCFGDCLDGIQVNRVGAA